MDILLDDKICFTGEQEFSLGEKSVVLHQFKNMLPNNLNLGKTEF